MLHSVSNQHLTVTVSERGAELQSVLSAEGIQYLWQADPVYWQKHAPNLFPYIGRMPDKTYRLDGCSYQMPIHGFAPTQHFKVIGKSETTLSLELTDNEETYAHYPRHFSFRITYKLEDRTLHISFLVENRDENTMYFAIGGHPGFRIPLVSQCAFEDYRLRFAEKCHPTRVIFDSAALVAGSVPYPLKDDCIIPLTHTLFDDEAIVLSGTGNSVTLETHRDHHAITVTYPQMKYIGFWKPVKTDAPFVCIEPWSALPSRSGTVEDLETQPDLTALAPGQTFENNWSITVK